MNTENLDLFAEQRQRKSQLVRLLSAYCQRYRLAGFDARHLTEQAAQDIASEVLDFFQTRLQEELNDTSKSGPTINQANGGAPTKRCLGRNLRNQ